MAKRKNPLSNNWFLAIVSLGIIVSALVVVTKLTSQKQPVVTSPEAGCTRCAGTGYSCSNNFLYRCVDRCLRIIDDCDFPWEDPRTCSATQRKCVNRCTDETFRCLDGASDDYLQVCANDRWTTRDTCGYNETCCVAAESCIPKGAICQ